MRWLRAWMVGGLVVWSSGCGTAGEEASAGCAATLRERLDPSSSLHLLPGAPEPAYLSDPPTSGPHLSGRPPTGVVTEPVDRPTQVLILEEGGVLIQYRDVDDTEVARLAGLATDEVVVAPNPTLASPVVATAWLARRACAEVDLEALRQFVDQHLGRGPEGGEATAG